MLAAQPGVSTRLTITLAAQPGAPKPDDLSRDPARFLFLGSRPGLLKGGSGGPPDHPEETGETPVPPHPAANLVENSKTAVLAKPDGMIVFVGPDGAPIELDGTCTAAKVTAGQN
jgi:hypothetical protein